MTFDQFPYEGSLSLGIRTGPQTFRRIDLWQFDTASADRTIEPARTHLNRASDALDCWHDGDTAIGTLW
jgi:hypothetical protein